MPCPAAVVAVLLLGVLGIGMAAPSAAAAHAELLSSDPGANATLLEAPEALTLTFSEAIDPDSVRVRVLDERQQEASGLGEPAVGPDKVTIRVPLPALDSGVYTVDYLVTSAVDGHITSGIFAFLVDPTGTEPAPAVSSSDDFPAAKPETTAARWVGLAATLALAGSVGFWLVSARPALARAGRRGSVPWLIFALLGLLALGGQVAYLMLAARPLLENGEAAGGFALDPAAPFGATRFAIAMRVAVAGSVAATVAAVAGWLLAGRPAAGHQTVALLLTLGAALAALAGMSFAGHAAASGGPLFAALDFVHLLGVAAWLGALAGVVVLAARDRPALGSALRRHSAVALVAAPVVMLTGIASSPLVLGAEARDLVASDYGNLLLAKVLLFGVAAGMGVANFLLIRRRLARLTLPVIGLELVVGALAVLAAAGLVTGQPAAGRAPVLSASAIGAAHLYGIAGESTVHAAVNLPAPGRQRYQVAVSDASSGDYRTDVQRVFLVFSPPSGSGLSPERVPLEPSEQPGLWGASGAYTPVVGSWQLQVVVRRAGELDEVASFPLQVTELLEPQPVPPPDTGVGVPAPVAVLWEVLPSGPSGWFVAVAALLGVAFLFALGRRWEGLGMAVPRVALVLVAVLIGLGVGSRALVDAANAPPPEAAARQNPVEATAQSVERGRSLYLANCSSCHGTDGAGDGPLAAGMLPPPAPLSERVPAMTDGALAHRISVGSAGTRMPAFAATLTETDRWDLVNFLRDRW